MKRNLVRQTIGLVSSLRNDYLLKYGGMMLVATIIGGALSWLYQLLVGNALRPEAYGAFGALFSIWYIASTAGGALQTTITRFVSQFRAEGKQSMVLTMYRGITKRMLLFDAILLITLTICSRWISSLLRLDSFLLVIILAISIALSLMLSVSLGILRGMQLFKNYGLNFVLESSGRFFLGALLLCLGLGLNGAIMAVPLSTALALFIAWIHVRAVVSNPGCEEQQNSVNIPGVRRYLALTTLATICLSIPASLDVIAVKLFFTSTEAGLYTAASVFGKVIIFIPMAIGTVMLPKISEIRTRHEDTRHILKKSLVTTALMCGVVVLLYWLFASQILTLFYNSEYADAAPLLKIYGVAMMFFALTQICLVYCLAVDRLRFIFILAGFTTIESVLFFILHNSMMCIVCTLLIINLALFAVSNYYMWRSRQTSEPHRSDNGASDNQK